MSVVRTRRRRQGTGVRVAAVLAMTALAFVVILPIYYLVVTTFKSPTEANESPLALPSSLDFSVYTEAFEKMNYPQAFANTLTITALSVLGVLLTASMAGYVLNRKGASKTATTVFLVILSGMMFPYQMSIMGLYDLVRGLGLMNTLASVILINIAINIPFATFLFRSFVSTIPLELEEAARMDGAGTFRTFWTIVFPLLRPVAITIAILNTLNVWNDFMGPLYFLQGREKSVILQEVYRNVGQFSTDWTSMFPMMVLGVLPLLLFYVLMQRFIIGGVMAGSVKG